MAKFKYSIIDETWTVLESTVHASNIDCIIVYRECVSKSAGKKIL